MLLRSDVLSMVPKVLMVLTGRDGRNVDSVTNARCEAPSGASASERYALQ